MASSDQKPHKRRRDHRADEFNPSQALLTHLPVNLSDAQALVAALLETYPDGRHELQNLFQMIDEGSSVEIDSISDHLVRDGLALLFQCLRLNFHNNQYTLGDRTPSLSSSFQCIFQNTSIEADVKLDQPSAVEREQPTRVIGPMMPPTYVDDDEDGDEFGPQVSADGKPIISSTAVRPNRELAPERSGRESWMTQLPEGRTGVSTAHGLVTRSFSRKGIRDVGDRSAWTDTAADKQAKFERMADSNREFKIDKKRKSMTSNMSPHSDINEERRPSLMEQYRANPQAQQMQPTVTTSVWDRERDLVRGTKVSVSHLKNIVADAKNISSRFTKGTTML